MTGARVHLMQLMRANFLSNSHALTIENTLLCGTHVGGDAATCGTRLDTLHQAQLIKD